MKKILNIVFVTLGIIFLILILIGAYFFIADPLNLKPLLFGEKAEVTGTKTTGTDSNTIQLSATQEKALETFGINPDQVPTEISAEQRVCFEAALGEARVVEIMAGATPSALDYFKAKDCI